MNTLKSFLVATGLLLILSGCQTSVAIKDLERDKLGHLKTMFAISEVPSGLIASAGTEVPAGEKFSQIDFKIRMDYDGKGSSSGYDFDVTVLNAGKGLRQEMWLSSNNGIPHVSEFKVTQLGLIPLRFQYGYHGAQRTLEVLNAKSVTISQAGAARPTEGGQFGFSFKTGGPIQIANLYEATYQCAAQKTYQANTIHPKLTGNAIDVECNVSNEGKTRSKTTYAYLMDYGYALKKSIATSDGRSVYRVNDASVR